MTAPMESCRVYNKAKQNAEAVGTIVVNTNEVIFKAFGAEKYDLLDSRSVHIENEPSLHPGWFEQDPSVILRAVEQCINDSVTNNEVMGARIKAVGIANHRCSVLAWNKRTGVALSNVILEQDNRSVGLIEEYLRCYDKFHFQKITGSPISPRFSAFKIGWLLDNNKCVKAAHKKGDCYFGTIDSWLTWNLTGGVTGGNFVTDSTNASCTFLMNINTLQWDKSLLKLFGVSLISLPKIIRSNEPCGMISYGPLESTPINSLIGNIQANLISQNCLEPGHPNVTLNWDGSVITITREKVFSKNGLITTIGYHLDPEPMYALEGPIVSAGRSIDWATKTFSVDNCACMNSEKQDEKRVYFVPAFSGLYAPHWHHEARGLLIGLGKSSKKADILNAAIDSVCFQVNDNLEATKQDMNTSINKFKNNGSLSSKNNIMQCLSNISYMQVDAAKKTETTALGAAVLAKTAPSMMGVLVDLRVMPELESYNYMPKMATDKRERRTLFWNRAVARSLLRQEKTSTSNFSTWVVWSVPIVSVAVAAAFIALRK